MAGKKIYAVKKGKKTGLFYTWEECRASVEGYPGAVYKGFSALSEAREYLDAPAGASAPGGRRTDTAGAEAGNRLTDAAGKEAGNRPTDTAGKATGRRRTAGTGQGAVPRKAGSGGGKAEKTAAPPDIRPSSPEELIAYVDGSYDDSLKKYAFGCVFLLADGSVYTECGNGDNPESLPLRNVTGEMLGAMFAVRFAITNGFKRVELCYDYQGIEKWVTGEWRSKTDLTKKYAAAMRRWGAAIEISFHKVAAHANVYYNELADRTAKRGLTEACGVPDVRRLQEMSPLALSAGDKAPE